MTVEAIKACPCCGGEGKLKDIHTKIRQGWVGCPECGLYIQWKISPDGAVKKWNRRAEISAAVFDRADVYRDCTVQVLTNTATGETSVGWWPAGSEPEEVAL